MNNQKQIVIIVILGAIIGLALVLGLVLSQKSEVKTEVIKNKEMVGCEKWVGIAELAKKDYPHFLNDSLKMAEMKCGFDVSNIIP